jgi:hypothetical protein
MKIIRHTKMCSQNVRRWVDADDSVLLRVRTFPTMPIDTFFSFRSPDCSDPRSAVSTCTISSSREAASNACNRQGKHARASQSQVR